MRVEQRSNHHYVYRDGRYEDQTGAAIAGGILGFMLGAAIAGSTQDRDYYNAHRNDGGWRSPQPDLPQFRPGHRHLHGRGRLQALLHALGRRISLRMWSRIDE
jgi:hypothetical protein